LGGLAAVPFAAHAQQSLPVIGFLGSDSPELYRDLLSSLRRGLEEAGYVEGRNVAIEYRWAEGQNDRLPELASGLVAQQVTVMAASTVPAVLALKAASTSIPIVFFVAADPIALGLVEV
jgi:putative tryptophan/tyrosine transport system substrate-binding protein